MPTTQSRTQQQQLQAQQPRQKGLYREDEPRPNNIMFDKRVVRGNTYAARPLPGEMQPSIAQRASKGPSAAVPRPRGFGTGEVPAVTGRVHIPVQTDVYLEELVDTVPENDNATQTDEFLDRPPTPTFVPPKSGMDAATQIEKGELFDFDAEVEPLLEVIVGKTLEQAIMELMEEQELAALQAHQAHFESVRAAELVAVQRMEAAEARKLAEKERRLAQEKERKEKERVVRTKVAAATFARGYLNGIMGSVFDRLSSAGFFYDSVQKTVEDEFMPWLTEQAVLHIEQGALARAVVQRLVADALALKVQMEADAEAAAAAAEAAEAARLAKEAEEAAARQAAVELKTCQAAATHLLTGLSTPLVPAERVAEVREQLKAKAESDADAAFEEAKARAGDDARAAATEQQAAAAAAAEAAAAAAAAAAEAADAAAEAGAEGEPAQAAAAEAPAAAEAAPIDVEGAVAAAVAAVARADARPVTDADVMAAVIDSGDVTRAACLAALAAEPAPAAAE